MSRRMEAYLDYAEQLGSNLNPDTLEDNPKKYLLTWIPGDEVTVQSLKTFETLDALKKYVEQIYNPWMNPKTILNLDTGKNIDWALGVDDISVPGKLLFNWGLEE